MFVTVERGGESIRTKVDEGATIKVLMANGSLRGIDTNILVNGTPANENTRVQRGDVVAELPKSGRLG